MDRRPELDGLRGIAIGMVLMVHIASSIGVASSYPFLGSLGSSGVTLFFVLSGYLITGILLRTQTSLTYFSDFYRRRALRILPLYCAFVLSVAALALLRMISPGVSGASWLFFAAFAQNFLPILGWRFYWPINVTWSLCVEEHFYLLWPLVILYASQRAVAGICLTAIAISVFWRAILTGDISALATPSNLDGISMGALLALGIAPGRWVWPAIAISAGGLFYGAGPATHCLFALICYVAVASANRIPFLDAAPLVWLGKRSYGLYLIHAVFIAALETHLTALPAWLAASIYLLGSFGLAELSYRCFESRFTKLRLGRSMERSTEPQPVTP